MRQEDDLVIDGETESMLLARYMTCVPGVKIADCGSPRRPASLSSCSLNGTCLARACPLTPPLSLSHVSCAGLTSRSPRVLPPQKAEATLLLP